MTRKSIKLHVSFRVTDRMTSTDLNDGNHLVLYRVRTFDRTWDDTALVSPSLRSSILQEFKWEKKQTFE